MVELESYVLSKQEKKIKILHTFVWERKLLKMFELNSYTICFDLFYQNKEKKKNTTYICMRKEIT